MDKITFTNEYGKSISFGPSPPLFLESIDPNSIGTTADSYRPIGADGQITKEVLYNPRTIIATLSFVGIREGRYSEAELRSIWLNVGNVLTPHKEGTLTYQNEGGVYFIKCRPLSMPNFNRAVATFSRFKIEFLADKSFWMSKTAFKSGLGQVEKMWQYPYSYPLTYGEWRTDAIIVNDCNVPVPVKIEIQSTAVHIKVTNSSTGEFIQVDKALTSLQKMIIDTEECLVTVETYSTDGSLTDTENANYLLTVDSTPDMKLQVGENTLIVENGVAVSNIPATVTYYKRYLVV